MKKRKTAVILAIVCILGLGTFVAAGTIAFDITVTAYGASNPDPYSYREVKDDGEQRFYVTCTGMSNSKGRLTYRSCAANGSVISDAYTTTYSELNRTRSTYYGDGKYAASGILYYMEGMSGYGADASYINLNVTGRYCP